MLLKDALRIAGLNRLEAEVVAYMLRHPEGYERDIEENTSLRQPEASSGINSLVKRDWVILIPKKEVGKKGRPLNYYYFDKDKMKEEILEELSELKNKIVKAVGVINEL